MAANIFNSLRIQNINNYIKFCDSNILYSFIGRTTEWPNNGDTQAPLVCDNDKSIRQYYKDIIGMKRITSDDIRIALPRINWKVDTVYDEYDDSVNMVDDKNPTTNDFYKFYVVTDEDNVYKCIFNNHDSASTVKPTGNELGVVETSDGYKWKYMYTIKSDDVKKFMTSSFIPCYRLVSDDRSRQWLVQKNAIAGAIHNIKFSGTGSFDQSNPPEVVITGDGTGCTAKAVVNSKGQLLNIAVTNAGKNYTYATATLKLFDTTSVNNIVCRPVISPIGGHGSNPLLELGGYYLMFHSVFNGAESNLPIDVQYRQVGLLSLPESEEKGMALALNTVNNITVGSNVKTDSGSSTVVHVDEINDIIYVNSNAVAFGANITKLTVDNQTYNILSSTERNLPLTASVVLPDAYKKGSGTIIYTATRTPIKRNKDQPDRMRFVIGF